MYMDGHFKYARPIYFLGKICYNLFTRSRLDILILDEFLSDERNGHEKFGF